MTVILLILSGIATALSLVFSELSFLAWFSIAPLVYVMIKETEKGAKFPRALLYGFIWFFTYYFVIYHWFTYLYPMEFVGATPAQAVGIIAVCWVGLALLQTSGSMFVPLVFRLTAVHKHLRPLLFAAVWVLFEYLQSLTWMGVPWARIAVSQAEFLPAIQSASLFGSLFVSFIVVLVNAYLALAVKAFMESGALKTKSVRIYALTALAIFLANALFGVATISLHKEDENRKFTAGLIQGNITSSDKWAISGFDALDLYVDMSYQAASEAELDLVLWPETVINFNLLNYPEQVDKVQKLAKDTGAIIYVGTFCTTSDSDTIYDYNSVLAFYPDGTIEDDPYNKQHLVPFGEYLPMADVINTVLPMLSGLNMLGSDLTPGYSSEIDDTYLGKIGRLICFDSIYPDLARRSAADGAEVILLSTNDSWYMDSSGVYQHNSHAVLRAVENRRWIIRAANTGISSVITSNGETVTYLEPLTQGYIIESAYMSDSRSLYSYIGDSFVIICGAFIAVEAVFSITSAIKKRKK